MNDNAEGIAYTPWLDVSDAIGRLRQILPQWTEENAPLNLIAARPAGNCMRSLKRRAVKRRALPAALGAVNGT